MLVPLTDFIFVGAALAWLLALATKQASFRRSRFYVPLALYLGALVIATVTSTVPRHSAIKLVGEVYLIGLAVLTFNLVCCESFMRRVMGAWLAGTALTVAVGLAGIFLFYLGVKSPSRNFPLSSYGSLPPGDYPRIQALFTNPNMLCTYLNISLAVCWVTHALGWLRPLWSRALHAGTWVVSFFTLSPGLGGCVLSAGLWGWARLKGTKHRCRGLLALTGGVLAAVAFFLATLVSPVTRGRGGVVLPTGRRVEPSSRVLVWQTAFATFRQYPILGRGLGAQVSSVEYLNASGRLEHLTDAHNCWLSIAGQGGVLGLATFLAVILYLVRNEETHREDDANGLLRWGLRTAFIGFLYQNLTGSFEDTRHLWVLIGLVAAMRDGMESISRHQKFVRAAAAER